MSLNGNKPRFLNNATENHVEKQLYEDIYFCAGHQQDNFSKIQFSSESLVFDTV